MQRNEVIGQQEVWNRLMEMVQENRLPHALMFCGPQGCGKLAMALAFAAIFWAIHRCSGNGNIRTSTSPFLPSRPPI